MPNKLHKQKPWQRRQFLSSLKKDGKPWVPTQEITRQRTRAELRKQHFKQLTLEYPGESRAVRRELAFSLAKRIYRGMRSEELKAA